MLLMRKIENLCLPERGGAWVYWPRPPRARAHIAPPTVGQRTDDMRGQRG